MMHRVYPVHRVATRTVVKHTGEPCAVYCRRYFEDIMADAMLAALGLERPPHSYTWGSDLPLMAHAFRVTP